jgi:hypothetical protein
MTVQKHVRFTDESLEIIEAFRKGQSPIPTFNDAVNVMLKDYGWCLNQKLPWMAPGWEKRCAEELQKMKEEVEKK